MFHTNIHDKNSDPNTEVSIVFGFLEYQKTSAAFINMKNPVMDLLVTVSSAQYISTNKLMSIAPLGSGTFPGTASLDSA